MRRTCVILSLIFISACAPVKPVEQPEQQTGFQFIEGTVQAVSGNEAAISLKLPEFKKTPDIPSSEIAQQVVQKSLFLEGIKTDINGIPAVIKEVRGSNITVTFEKPQAYPAGTALRLTIPRKIIAIVDFEVIRGREKEAGRVTLEGLTSALIDSGHFIVVERSKLKTIMNELELSLSGLTKEPPEKIMGRLLTADLILTGTLAEVGGVWDINLRLINVRTGHAMAAIAMRTPLFKPAELRDASALNEDFEGDVVNPSWQIGYKGRGVFLVKMDATAGAENSKHSLKIDFDLAKAGRNIFANAENRSKRDLSLFSGIEFYVKADVPLTGHLALFTSERENPNIIDAWAGNFEIDASWKLIRIPFEQLTIGRAWIKEGAERYGAKPGKQILDLSRVESVRIGVHSGNNPPVKGTMWIDKVRFYRE
ncbi:MAG: CsgG/HfaB family protein [Nitrospirae bacterium]|nr:CsgG/HfaB family protein [Nitrospirota bacterium]MCL5977211.1 CsgG/HfaB family protein [Nitrospirota bacterium]